MKIVFSRFCGIKECAFLCNGEFQGISYCTKKELSDFLVIRQLFYEISRSFTIEPLFLNFNKKGACSQFIYSCVCRAPCCVFSVKNHGVSVNFLALSSVFRYICYIEYQFLSNTGLSKTGSMDNRPGVLSLFTFSIDPVFFSLTACFQADLSHLSFFYPSI